MTSLEERYKKALANLEKTAAVYYPLLMEYRASEKWIDVPGFDKASQEYYKTVPEERRLAAKLQAQAAADIKKLPLPPELRREIQGYAGLKEEVPPAKPQAMLTMQAQELAKGKVKGGRASRKTRKNRKTRRRRV